MHCVTEGDWTERYKGHLMDVLSEAKEKGVIRAHGCSCHSIEGFAGCGKIIVGRSRSSSHQSHWIAHGRRSRDGGERDPEKCGRRVRELSG